MVAKGWGFASPVWIGVGCTAEDLVLQVTRKVVRVRPDGSTEQFGPDAELWNTVGGCLAAWQAGQFWLHCEEGETTIATAPGVGHWSLAGTPPPARHGWLILSSYDAPGLYAMQFDTRTGASESPWYALPMDHTVRAYEPVILGRQVCVPSFADELEETIPESEVRIGEPLPPLPPPAPPAPPPPPEPVRCFTPPR